MVTLGSSSQPKVAPKREEKKFDKKTKGTKKESFFTPVDSSEEKTEE